MGRNTDWNGRTITPDKEGDYIGVRNGREAEYSDCSDETSFFLKFITNLIYHSIYAINHKHPSRTFCPRDAVALCRA